MQPLTYFLAGVIFAIFVMPVLELFLQILTNYTTLHANKLQRKIKDMYPEDQEYNPNTIGFQVSEEEYYDEEE